MPRSTNLPTGSETAKAVRSMLMPALLLREGRVMLSGPNGPAVARTASHELFDVLDVADQLAAKYGRIYLVDLDGIERDRPQLDYLQEISRAAEVWVDAGVRSGDEAIDIVVAGAYRTVLSSAQLAHAEDLDRAWKLSPELAFEIVLDGATVRSKVPAWSSMSPATLATEVRRLGLTDLVVSPNGAAIDWGAVGSVCKGGPTWVAGSFEAGELERAREAGAAGGIFPIDQELEGAPG